MAYLPSWARGYSHEGPFTPPPESGCSPSRRRWNLGGDDTWDPISLYSLYPVRTEDAEFETISDSRPTSECFDKKSEGAMNGTEKNNSEGPTAAFLSSLSNECVEILLKELKHTKISRLIGSERDELADWNRKEKRKSIEISVSPKVALSKNLATVSRRRATPKRKTVDTRPFRFRASKELTTGDRPDRAIGTPSRTWISNLRSYTSAPQRRSLVSRRPQQETFSKRSIDCTSAKKKMRSMGTMEMKSIDDVAPKDGFQSEQNPDSTFVILDAP